MVSFLLFIWLCGGIGWGIYAMAKVFGWIPEKKTESDADWRNWR
jgi:hypothetical protein